MVLAATRLQRGAHLTPGPPALSPFRTTALQEGGELKKARSTRQPETRRDKLSAEADAILRRAGEKCLASLGGHAGRIKRTPGYSDALGVRATLAVRFEPDPDVINSVAKAVHVKARIVMETRRDLERFTHSPEYRKWAASAEALRPRQPATLAKAIRIERGPNGRPCIVHLAGHVKHREFELPNPAAKDGHLSRYRAFAWEGDPVEVDEAFEAAYMASHRFAAWLSKRHPRTRPTTLDRAVKIALCCLSLESHWRADPISLKD